MIDGTNVLMEKRRCSVSLFVCRLHDDCTLSLKTTPM